MKGLAPTAPEPRFFEDISQPLAERRSEDG